MPILSVYIWTTCLTLKNPSICSDNTTHLEIFKVVLFDERVELISQSTTFCASQLKQTQFWIQLWCVGSSSTSFRYNIQVNSSAFLIGLLYPIAFYKLRLQRRFYHNLFYRSKIRVVMNLSVCAETKCCVKQHTGENKFLMRMWIVCQFEKQCMILSALFPLIIRQKVFVSLHSKCFHANKQYCEKLKMAYFLIKSN